MVDAKGLDDGGVASFTFEVDQLVKGKIYTQADQRWYDEHGQKSAPFFVDDNGCSNDIEWALAAKIVEEVRPKYVD